MSTYGTTKKDSGVPLDQCNPPEMVAVLLDRLKVSELDEAKKSLLCVELNDLLWFFEKHPKDANMFRSDLLEWRLFLKQSKAYMDDMFESKMARTKRILDHLMGKPRTYQSKAAKTKRETSYYQIVFRPGIRSVREYPINVEQYGDYNAEIDQLHKQLALMREEIIYAPQKTISSATKNVLLNILLSIVEICAYDVLDGMGFVKQMQVLIKSIVEGEAYRERTGIVGYMASLTTKLKEHAKCHWAQGISIKRRMWDDIAGIERDLELKNNPKFDLEVLTKSEFLKMEKMKDTRREVVKEQTGENIDVSDVIKKQGTPSQCKSSISESFYDPSLPIVVLNKQKRVHSIRGCSDLGYRRAKPKPLLRKKPARLMPKRNLQPPKKAKKQRPSHKRSTKLQIAEWANNIMKKYRKECRCGGDVDKNHMCISHKGIKYIPDAEVEEETIFKCKENPKTRHGLLRHVTIPPVIDDTDMNTPLINLIRVEIEGSDEERTSPELPTDINPVLGRNRVLEH
ncbi:hypothetical protein GE061_019752 [Apolygus lucorum]|uniref:Uncharacterized protein n=1 Tax=Apolygus lucorum TaxID=248454 RepID=A0A6A4JV29_APOLU|nr:hypothetical protein GE061_019752 [Apolygus lucorum]